MLYLKTVTETMTENEAEARINKKKAFLQTFSAFTVCNCIYCSNEFTSFNSS